MIIKEDNTYNEMKGRTILNWLNGQIEAGDKINSSGAKVTLEYIDYLNRKIKALEDKNALKDEYLKKIKQSR
ncbi:MAG: hypothetical protein Q4F66_10185 [Clostridium sp.]|nr:hypothetical protein [Clostridium sp.]